MSIKEKLNTRTNNLYTLVKKLQLTEDEIHLINLKGFLYSVNRCNDQQICVILADIALKHNIELSEIINALE